MHPAFKDPLSFVSSQIEMRFGDVLLGVGTAFHYKHRDKIYLITAWHNVTGCHPDTLEPISPTLGVPDSLSVYVGVRRTIPNSPEVKIGWSAQKIVLYDNGMPTWSVHPHHGRKVDAVAFLVGGFDQTMHHPANGSFSVGDRLGINPGADVFILGFPRGMSGGGKFPIWKRGSIAHEPQIDIDYLPKMLVDTATREGMSGAPVFTSGPGTWLEDQNGGFEGSIPRRFLGIYTGRVGDDPFQAQLGIVWKEKAIIEIIEGGIAGQGGLGEPI